MATSCLGRGVALAELGNVPIPPLGQQILSDHCWPRHVKPMAHNGLWCTINYCWGYGQDYGHHRRETHATFFER